MSIRNTALFKIVLLNKKKIFCIITNIYKLIESIEKSLFEVLFVDN